MKDETKHEFWHRHGPSQTLLAEISAEDAQALADQIKQWVDDLVGSGRAKPVYVDHVDMEVYSKHLAGRASRAKPFDLAHEQVFPSALHLSRHIGFTSNQVAMALSRAKTEERSKDDWRPRYMATVRGVTFCYIDDHVNI